MGGQWLRNGGPGKIQNTLSTVDSFLLCSSVKTEALLLFPECLMKLITEMWSSLFFSATFHLALSLSNAQSIQQQNTPSLYTVF